jgi:hypothetical protein
MIQRGTLLKSTNHEFSALGESSDERSVVESDEGSDRNGSEDSFKALRRRSRRSPVSARSESLTRETVECVEIPTPVYPVPAFEVKPEEVSWSSSKKKSNKSKIAANWGAEE